MKYKTKIFLLVTIFLASLSISLIPENAQIQMSNFADLKLQISTLKQHYIEGEPIPFILKLKNESDTPIMGHPLFDFTSNYTYLRIRQEDGTEEIFHGFSPISKLVRIIPRFIKPGEKYEKKELLNYRLDEMFPHPGRYEIQAILINTDGTKRAFSDTISVEIVNPEGLDEQALNFIKTSSNSKMFFSGGLSNQSLSDMDKFVKNYGDSVYGDYVAFNLGEFYFHKKDYQKAAKYLHKLANKDNFHYAERVKSYLNEIQEK